MQGSKTFQFTFMPKSLGTYSIPPIVVSYFDPKVNKYHTVQTDSTALTVVGAEKQNSNAKNNVSTLVAKDNLELKN